MNSAPRAAEPAVGVSSDGTLAGSATGPPSTSARCTPTPRFGASASSARAPSRSAQFPSRDVLVTIPSRCARRMPREIDGDMPKSSAFTTRRMSVAASNALRIMPQIALDGVIAEWARPN